MIIVNTRFKLYKVSQRLLLHLYLIANFFRIEDYTFFINRLHKNIHHIMTRLIIDELQLAARSRDHEHKRLW